MEWISWLTRAVEMAGIAIIVVGAFGSLAIFVARFARRSGGGGERLVGDFRSDLGRAILVAAVPLAYWLGLPTMTVLLLVVVPIACLRVLWAAGFTSAIPGLVGPALLGKANSVMEAKNDSAASRSSQLWPCSVVR